jgi:transposase
MTRLALALSITLLFMNISNASAQKAADERGVRATVADYIEGYYTRDVARMEGSIHPHYLKHTISSYEGKMRMSETTGLQLLQEVRESGPASLAASEQKEEITVLDVAGDVASAKLVTAHWTDHLTLSRWNGQWKIVSIVLREND